MERSEEREVAEAEYRDSIIAEEYRHIIDTIDNMMEKMNKERQELADREWSYYAINAKTASIFPKNEDTLRRILNKFARIIPNVKQ